MSTGQMELLVGEMVGEGAAEPGLGATTKIRRSTKRDFIYMTVYAVLKLDSFCLFMHDVGIS